MRLAGIFNDSKLMLRSNLQDRIHVCRQAVKVHRQNGSRAGRHSRSDFGDIDVGGGTSTSAGNSGGDAGVFQLNGIAGTQTMGALLGVGGSASGASSAGGGGGYFGFFSDAGAVQNAASITDDGGQGTSIGGVGGTVELLGVTVNNSKAISCDGGAGADLGGDGGAIHLFSSMGPSVNSGTLSVAGGAATVAGNGGTVLVDGIVTGS